MNTIDVTIDEQTAGILMFSISHCWEYFNDADKIAAGKLLDECVKVLIEEE